MPKIVNHEEYKEKLLMKCFEIFAKRGFDRVTLRELASELGISNGALYYYFPSKENILEELFSIFTKRDVEAMLKMFEGLKANEEKIGKIFDYVSSKESYFQNILLFTIDYFRNNSHSSNRNRLNEYVLNYRDGIGSIVGLDKSMSSLLIVFLNGLVYNRLIFPGVVSFKDHSGKMKTMIQLFLKKTNNKILNQE